VAQAVSEPSEAATAADEQETVVATRVQERRPGRRTGSCGRDVRAGHALSARVLDMALPQELWLDGFVERAGLRVEEVRCRAATGLLELRHRLEVRADAH
jgi:hypothetical protein